MPISELQDRKLNRAFEHLDMDRDGVIERDDLLGLAARFLLGFGEPPTSLRGKALLDNFDQLWAALVSRLDLDGDSRISREEFRRGMTTAFIEGPDYESAFRPAVQAAARLCDADCDGMIDPSEFRTMHTAYGTPENDISMAFSAIDTDEDGMVTVTELVHAAREFYIGDDPRAGGTWLFGRI